MTGRAPRIAVVAPALELAQWWGPVIAALHARGEARMFTAQAWAGLAEDPTRSRVTIVGEAGRVGERDGEGAYSGVLRLSPRIVPALWRYRPDVVIAQGFSLWTMLVILTRPLARWRVVVLWEGSSPSVDRRESGLHTRLRRLLGRAADKVMTSNQRSVRYLTDHLGLTEDDIAVHPYLVGSPQAMLAAGGDAVELDGCEGPLWVHVGRLEPRKGIAQLLRALGPSRDLPFTLAMIGKGPQEQELQDLAEELGLSSHLRWLGWQDYGRVGSFIQRADLLVFPTLEDTWGLVAVEAMSLGTTVACSVAAGASEVVRDGVDGVLIDPTDAPALQRQLAELLRRTDLAEMGEAARTRASMLTPEAAAAALWQAAADASR